MLKKTMLSKSLMMAFSGTALLSGAVFAQTAPTELQRVEITGSSIKRINAEAALPVQVISREDIKKSGFTSATELLQSIPAMQGFTTNSQSVNGGGGGTTTASLHSIGSQYTLVLLNGRRLAPFNSGTTVSLNTIPLAAIERIEVLLDGASAVYGADAIAGVVNFITRKDSTDGEITLSANIPQHDGGKSATASISKGFGDLERDRFNVFFAASFDKQKKLTAAQRSFSQTGFIPFTDNGRKLTTFLASSNTIPGNVFLNDNDNDELGDGKGDAAYNPYYLATGSCAPKSVLRGGICRYDFGSTVESIPEMTRASFYGTGRFKVAEAFSVFGELAYSDFKSKPVFAAPAQPGIYLTQALVDKHVTPYLAQLGIGPTDYYGVDAVDKDGNPNFLGPTMNLRVYDAGGRQDEYRTKSTHAVIGVDGTVAEFDYSAYYTHSVSKNTDTLLSGYLSANAFDVLVNNGSFDPLSAQIGESTAVLAPAVLHQLFDTTKSTIDILHGQVSKPLFKLAGGDFQVAIGAEAGRQRYSDDPSAIAQGQNALQPNFTDTPIGGSSGSLPVKSQRRTTGVFAEVVAPVAKGLELIASLRHDSATAVTNSANFDPLGNPAPAATQGKSASANTYKLSARYQPVPEFLVRGSYGTGFKAPTLNNITEPVQAFGSTGFHDCPPGLAADLAAFCKNDSSEYNIRQGGNPNTDNSALRPEKSKQWTVGFRVEPSPALSIGADLWSVRLKDRIGFVEEDTAFSDGATYANAFSVRPDPVTGAPTLTFSRAPLNLGKAAYRGIDLDVVSRAATPVGRLTTSAKATYIIQSDYEITGLEGYQTSLGKIGPDTEVTFRYLLNLSASLETGAFTNTFALQFKPSYGDHVATTSSGPEVREVNPDGTISNTRSAVNREVASYTLLNFQTRYAFTKDLSLTFGINNLLDHNPPFSIQDLSGTGNARGFDGRYTDPLGRTFYLAGSYKF